ncbi:hypothetical protein BDV95DRAFT_606546 [Massariosphaeria phaeospora]|uniref:Uncharacterized protein n=1 Tax=Massariosphaeria phaeospora TaxID=100035 RepID=A0A7C8M8X7_9PLEO|nr:hypothetical protein BDV95DRAFT_606546 [Massariosphaeria phaeospora]
MSSSNSPQGPPRQTGPGPYAPSIAGLGGVPDLIPDVVASSVFLVFYVALAATHMTLFQMNKARGHKFVFSGALFGFSTIRVATMSLRIAWAFYHMNVRLAIAAQVFVYAGTIILYLVNWFLAQRIVRAQHPRWGWSKPYRVFHRAGLFGLIFCLLLLIVAAVQQFFTLDKNTRRIDRNLQLTGQTYFAVFCFAPAILIFISLVLPRKGTEKFGAGRLRNNIAIVVIAVLILSTGQIFRCATAWLTPTPLRNAQGRPVTPPWYLSKSCFYTFNFTTEAVVVIFYALTRVDLRFHVPDGAKQTGDYARGRDKPKHVDIIGDEKKLKRFSTRSNAQPYSSSDVLHEYDASPFDDARTLADSLRYPSSVLEVDSNTGNWKVKRISRATSSSTLHDSRSIYSTDRETCFGDDVPPVPDLPTDWPLRESQMPSPTARGVLEHQNRTSRPTRQGTQRHELDGHGYNGVDMSTAIADALAQLEGNGTTAKSPVPHEDAITPVDRQRSEPAAQGSTYQDYSQIKRRSTPSQSHAPTGSNLPITYEYCMPAGSGSTLPITLHDSSASAPAPVISNPRAKQPSEPSSTRPTSGDTDQSFDTAEEDFPGFSFEASPRKE